MKRVFLIAFAVLSTLTACAERQKVAENATKQVDIGGSLYKQCYEGVSYIFSYNGGVVVQRDKDDKPVTCGE